MAIHRGGLRVLNSFLAEGVKDFLNLSAFSITIGGFVFLWQ